MVAVRRRFVKAGEQGVAALLPVAVPGCHFQRSALIFVTGHLKACMQGGLKLPVNYLLFMINGRIPWEAHRLTSLFSRSE